MYRPGYAKLAWSTLAFNVLVILWGGVVRASGSGAGCGGHWPLCNGEVIPRAPALATAIEFSHRLTSAVAIVLVASIAVGAWRYYPRHHPVRRGAALSVLFMVTEALVGAALVLLELVAHNTSTARGFWVAGHLLNTFLLLAALTLTAWWASGGPPLRLRFGSSQFGGVASALFGVLVLAMSGAVTALGDTLFPAASLAEAEAQTFSRTAHLFVRLRLWHPVLAFAVGFMIVAMRFSSGAQARTASKLAGLLTALYVVQLLVGGTTVWLLAPVPAQIAHLFLADLVWIVLVLLSAASLSAEPAVPKAEDSTSGAERGDKCAVGCEF